MNHRDVEEMRSRTDPRVPLAMERTFLAWIRTGLAMMGFGFVVARFSLFLREIERIRGGAVPVGSGVSPMMGTALVALGVIVTAYAAVRLRRGVAAVERGDDTTLQRAAVMPAFVAVSLCAIGAATIWYFLAMA